MAGSCGGHCDGHRGRVDGLGPPAGAARALAGLAPVLLGRLGDLAGNAATLASTQRRLASAQTQGWVRSHLERWIRELLQLPFGRDFLMARIELTRCHEQMAIRLCDMLTLSDAVRTVLEGAIRQASPDPEVADQAVLAVHRLSDLDLLVWNHVRPEEPGHRNASRSGGPAAGCVELGSCLGDLAPAGLATLAIVVDAGGRVVSVDPVAEAAIGWTSAELRGRRFLDLGGEMIEGCGSEGCGARSQADLTQALPLMTRGGERRLVRWTSLPCGDEGASETLMLGRDVTEATRQAFESWTEARRASVGHLAAGIAHAVGNMASSISAVLQTLERKVTDEYVLGKTRVMSRHVTRITDVLQKMVDLGRIPSREWKQRSVADVMARALEYALLDKRIRRVNLVVDLSPQDRSVLCLEDYLLEAFLSVLLYCLEVADNGPPGRRPELRIETWSNRDGVSPMFGLRLTETGLAEGAVEAPDPESGAATLPIHPGLAASGQIVAQHGGELGFEAVGPDGFRFVIAVPER